MYSTPQEHYVILRSMKGESPASSALAAEPLASYYMRRLLQTVELAGATFCGFQQGWGEDLVLFNHPLTHSTLALPVSQLSIDNIRAKIAARV